MNKNHLTGKCTCKQNLTKKQKWAQKTLSPTTGKGKNNKEDTREKVCDLLVSSEFSSNSSLTSFWYLAFVWMCSSLLGADDSDDNGAGVSNSAAIAFSLALSCIQCTKINLLEAATSWLDKAIPLKRL